MNGELLVTHKRIWLLATSPAHASEYHHMGMPLETAQQRLMMESSHLPQVGKTVEVQLQGGTRPSFSYCAKGRRG